MKYGPNTKTVEAFTRHLKGMTPEQWRVVLVARNAASNAASNAAWDAADDAAWDAAMDAALDVADDAALVARYAVYEILGATLMRERGQPFYFLPMFGFNSPEAVLAADQAN